MGIDCGVLTKTKWNVNGRLRLSVARMVPDLEATEESLTIFTRTTIFNVIANAFVPRSVIIRYKYTHDRSYFKSNFNMEVH